VAVKQFVLADESGTHEDSAYCIVAGYRGSPGHWEIFNKEWRGILQRYDVPVFHSNVFFNRKRITNPKKNPYLDWPSEKADKFLGELLGAISRRRVYPVGCSVNTHDFGSCSYGERCVLAGYQPTRSGRKSQRPAPYHLAFREMLLDAVDQTHSNAALHFIVALQEQYQRRAVEAFWLTKKYAADFQSNQLRGIAFEEPVHWPGLQAADLLARHWYNCSIRIWAGRGLNKENISTMNILTHKRADMPHCDAAGIERMFAYAGVSEHDREVLRTVREPRRGAD
jgi:hypothetical protein